MLSQPDWQTAIFLAAVCSQTYMQYENKSDGLFLVPKTYRLLGTFTAKSYDNRPEPFGFVMVSDQAAVLAFRGTSSAVEWISDFIAQQGEYLPVTGAGMTHKGFTDIYMTARSQLLNLLEEVPSSLPLFITGHSLGGALATLAALDIVHNTVHNPVVYTYGAPRVGDTHFVRLYNHSVVQHWRIQNEFDIVTHLPPLVYQSPKTKENYFYLHVKGEVLRSFRHGSVPGNHVISSYFNDLAKENTSFAEALCMEPPGWCPIFQMEDK